MPDIEFRLVLMGLITAIY